MARGAAVSVDDDLPSGESRVAHRASDLELAGRVHEEAGVELLLGEELLVLLVEHRLDHVLPEVLLDQRLAVDARPVLGRDEELHDLDRTVVLVPNGDLRLAVGTEVGDDLGLPDLGQAPGKRVRHLDRHRHQRPRLAGRVPEHHPLVAGPRPVELVLVVWIGARLIGGLDAAGDVRRLLVDRGDDGAGIRVESVLRPVVADPVERLPDDPGDVDVGLGRDLAGDDHKPRVDEALACDAAARVVGHHGVEDAVRDLVADLVRMALGDRLRREEVLACRKLRGSHLATSPRDSRDCTGPPVARRDLTRRRAGEPRSRGRRARSPPRFPEPPTGGSPAPAPGSRGSRRAPPARLPR